MKVKLAIFDVDKTVIRGDSMFQFLMYGLLRKPLTAPYLVQTVLYSVLYKLKLLSAEKAKSSYFTAIRFMEEKDLAHFYQTRLMPTVFPEAVKEMKEMKRQGHHVLLVTASPYVYMKYFEELPFVDKVIATKLVMSNDRFTSMIEGQNCKGREKVHRIQAYLDENRWEIDYESSCAYSDSLSDLPMMELVKKRYWINRKSSHGCEGLIWSR